MINNFTDAGRCKVSSDFNGQLLDLSFFNKPKIQQSRTQEEVNMVLSPTDVSNYENKVGKSRLLGS